MAEHNTPAASLQAFFACCPEMLFVASADGKVLQWSAAMERALGEALDRGTTLSALAHPDDRVALTAAWTDLRHGDDATDLPVRLIDAQGSYRAFSLSAARSAGDDAIHGSLRKATSGGDAATPSLKERLLDCLADHMSVSIWAVDRDGTFVYHDGKGVETAGLARGELLGKNLFQIPESGGSDPDAVSDTRRALAGQPVHRYTRTNDVHWENWLVPVLDARGAVDGVMGFMLDVSEGRRAEEELRARISQIEKQQAVIRDLSTPIIEVWNGVLTLPMIGVVDSVRTAEVMDALLARIVDKQARFAILDLTGVEVVDTQVASHLIQLTTAIKLLGAEGIVAGIKPNVAQTMVALGLDLSQLVTQRDLRASLTYCIRRMSAETRAANFASR